MVRIDSKLLAFFYRQPKKKKISAGIIQYLTWTEIETCELFQIHKTTQKYLFHNKTHLIDFRNPLDRIFWWI